MGSLTRRQMWMLQNEAGYSIISEDTTHIELTRPADFLRRKHTPVLDEIRKNQLTAQLNRIIDLYIEPIWHRDEICTRIRNITRTMTSLESDFVWEWVSRNLE